MAVTASGAQELIVQTKKYLQIVFPHCDFSDPTDRVSTTDITLSDKNRKMLIQRRDMEVNDTARFGTLGTIFGSPAESTQITSKINSADDLQNFITCIPGYWGTVVNTTNEFPSLEFSAYIRSSCGFLGIEEQAHETGFRTNAGEYATFNKVTGDDDGSRSFENQTWVELDPNKISSVIQEFAADCQQPMISSAVSHAYYDNDE